MASDNQTLLIIGLALAFGVLLILLMRDRNGNEPFTPNYLKNVAVGNEPATNQVFSMPSYYASVDPRFENQGVSGLRGGGSAPREQLPFSTSGGSMYTAEEMINMGGCADMCSEDCPKSKTGYAYIDPQNAPITPMTSSKNVKSSASHNQTSSSWNDFKSTEQKFGRFTEYQNAVKAEDLLPKPDIAANVDPSQYIVYDRNMGSMMMKSGNRTPVDFIRGDVIPVTANHTPTISARINDPDSPMFVPRFGSDIGTLQRGYFTNYNDVVQVLEERNSSYFMSKAQGERLKLKENSGMA
jgi:hypothetical protein